MPELPELEVVQEVLKRRVVGQTIARVELVQPTAAIVVRDLTGRGLVETLTGRTIEDVARRGKFLVMHVAGRAPEKEERVALVVQQHETAGATNDITQAHHVVALVINPKLTGRLQLAAPGTKRYKKTAVALTLADGTELRYFDDRAMGQVYLTDDVERVPEFAGMGPEPFDVTREQFRERLKPYRGEVKGILTRGAFLAGIGNAYADEILWHARLNPFRKRTQLTNAEIDGLYDAIQTTLREAIDRVRDEMGERIQEKPRDWFAVHMKTGEPCPRCGTPVSAVTANQRLTNFCRTCQPGGLIRGM